METSVLERRVASLKKMNNHIYKVIEDEHILETWVTLGVPDCVEENLKSIAEDNESYIDIRNLFVALVNYQTLKKALMKRRCV